MIVDVEEKICECGKCGRVVKPGRRFVLGHNPPIFTEETLQKMRKLKGPQSEEHRKNHKKSQNTPETKEKRSNAKKKNWKDPVYRENQILSMRNRDNTQLITTLNSPETKAKRAITN